MTSIILQYQKNSDRIKFFDSWLYSAIHYHYCMFVRKKKTNQLVFTDSVFVSDMAAEEFPETKMDISVIKEEIKRLGSPYREIVELRIFKNLKHKEISKTLGIKLLTVRKYYRRAIKKIAENLELLVNVFIFFLGGF